MPKQFKSKNSEQTYELAYKLAKYIKGGDIILLNGDLGAGKTDISNVLVLNDCDIDGGAGEIVIDNSELSNLDLDMGVGKVTISGK